MERLDQIWLAVSSSVCRICAGDAAHGDCRIQHGAACPLKDYFPQVVEAIESVRAATLAPYVKALRNAVCLNCGEQLGAGKCVRRDNAGCPLDRYYHIVIESVGEALSRAA